MKRLLSILLAIITLFTLATTSYAATTLFLGKSIDGKERLEYNDTLTADTDGTLIDLSYTKLLKISLEYEPGEYEIDKTRCSREIWLLQAGYPLIIKDDDFLYFTVGNFNYSLYKSDFLGKIKYETNLATLGFDLAATITDKFSFDLAIQHSISGGEYHLYKVSIMDSYNKNLPVDLTVCKLQLRYILTDNLGIVMNCRFLRFEANDSSIPIRQDVRNTYMGLVYRF